MPKLVVPSRNWTVPVGLLPATVAAKVTDWPKVTGLRDAVTVVVVLPTTIWFKAADVLAVFVLSPLYTAVIGCVPAASDDVVRVAMAPDSGAGFPSVAAPSMNWMEPLGLSPLTIAVKVRGWPAIAWSFEVRIDVAEAAGNTVSTKTADVLGAFAASPL